MYKRQGDIEVVDDKLFVSYIMYDYEGNNTNATEASIAVYSYPDLVFEKIITDTRAANIGRYNTKDALITDENGDLYTISTSSIASGFLPAPDVSSGILRIKSGETEFDEDYHIDFEELSGGYKLNDIYYVGDGKAVVRIINETEEIENATYEYEGVTYYTNHWAAYYALSENPLLELGVIDLYNEEFELVTGAPNGGGSYFTGSLVEDGKLYLSISNSNESGVYIIDPETAVSYTHLTLPTTSRV